MCTNDIFYNSINFREEYFINRNEIRKIIEEYYMRFNIDGTRMFQVFYIYGFGGMGKTYLIKYLKKEFLKTLPSNCIIHITFEIQESWHMIYALIKLRKAFNHSCPIFDYAILYYWDLEHIERLNDNFVKLLKNDVISAYTDLGLDFSSGILDFFVPSFSDLQNIINNLYFEIKNKRIRSIISEIIQMEPRQIYENLPRFLANDMKAYMQKWNTNYVFLFDSYQQSIPYSESAEWLLTFINELQKGLYIITGREDLQWKSDFYKIKKYYLDIYPENEAREYLKCIIPSFRSDILDTIISVSGCIPIYVSLAYDLYTKEKKISTDDLIKKSKFKDRQSIVRHFVNHLQQNWQDIILYLAIIKIFNNEIFDHLIDDLNLPCSKLDFYEIINISLFKYVENTNDLYKLHDVFCSNVVSILNPDIINRIFYSYVNFITKRNVFKNIIKNNLDSMIALFTNILELCKDYSNIIYWKTDLIENIINLFLVISDTRMMFSIPKPSKTFSPELNDCLYFMDAIIYEKVNTNETIYKLKQIKNPKLFGKHFYSYNITLKYEEALSGNYKSLKKYLENLERKFTEKDTTEWYYLKTFIYLSDYYIMEGKFTEAYGYLEDLRNSLSIEIFNTDNYFLIERSIGHIYRFNYNFENGKKKI